MLLCIYFNLIVFNAKTKAMLGNRNTTSNKTGVSPLFMFILLILSLNSMRFSWNFEQPARCFEQLTARRFTRYARYSVGRTRL